MQETLISFETAKLAKEKGFNIRIVDFYLQDKSNSKPYLTTGVEYQSERDCIWDWNLNGGESGNLVKVIPYPNDDRKIYTSAPTQSLLQKWLREVHDIIVEVVTYYNETDLPLNKPIKPKGYFAWDYYNENFSEEKAPKFKTYEQALEHGLFEGLKLIPDEKHT